MKEKFHLRLGGRLYHLQKKKPQIEGGALTTNHQSIFQPHRRRQWYTATTSSFLYLKVYTTHYIRLPWICISVSLFFLFPSSWKNFFLCKSVFVKKNDFPSSFNIRFLSFSHNCLMTFFLTEKKVTFSSSRNFSSPFFHFFLSFRFFFFGFSSNIFSFLSTLIYFYTFLSP